MDWALRKRSIYLSILLLIILAILFPFIYGFFSKDASCFDGKRNGNEEGLDCGGGCEKVCEFSTQNPIVLWSRSFEIRDGVYSSVAMIENPNIGTGALNVPYVFKLFDRQNILVFERKGLVDIPAQAKFPVFEGSISTGERKPSTTFFEFTGNVDWIKQQESQSSDLRIREQKVLNLDSSPKIEVLLENRGFKSIINLEVFVVVYDLSDNAINSSKTKVDNIPADSTRLIVFTWPKQFQREIGRIEIIPKFDTK